MTELNRKDIQGNVLLGYKFRHVLHLFGELTNAPANVEGWRAFLNEIYPRVTRAVWREEPETTLNVGLSYRALAALQPALSREIGKRFPAFQQGMSARAKVLGDSGDFQREPWEARDIWIVIYGDEEAPLRAAADQVRGLARGLGLGWTGELRGDAIFNEYDDENGPRFEHFGFRDDISYPAFEGIPSLDQHDIDGRGKLVDGKWVALKSGEFLLGYPNESDDAPLDELSEGAQRLLYNGTFGVFRHLQQHVAQFRRYVEELPGEDAEYIAERMMGRKRNGDPLVPLAPGASGASALSNFDYCSDPKGARCPLGSHVRRSNPRTSDGRHRLIRRGMPFGKALPPGAKETEPVGLLFVAFNADIEDQFEFVQRVWCNGLVVNNVPDARDPIACTMPRRSMMIEGDVAEPRAPRPLTDIPKLVSCLGGQYYFYPGMAGLELIGAAAPKSSPPSRVSHP